MDIVIRPARMSDLDRLVELETQAFVGDRLSRRSLRHFLFRNTAEISVAETGRKVVGAALVRFRAGAGIARLYSLAVEPGFEGRGIGRALLGASERAAAARGCRALRLEVRDDNTRAIALYRDSGYRPIGSEHAYYEDGATALRLDKALRPGTGAVAAAGAACGQENRR